jgi:hypothetical protein
MRLSRPAMMRRQLLEQTRDHVLVFAQDSYGIFHLAEYSLLLGITIKDRPDGTGTRRQILAKYGLTAHSCTYIRTAVKKILFAKDPDFQSE